MVSLTEFVVQLLVSTVDLLVIFVTDVALLDPLSFVSWLTGVAVMTFTLLVGAYLVVGALADAVSGSRA